MGKKKSHDSLFDDLDIDFEPEDKTMDTFRSMESTTSILSEERKQEDDEIPAGPTEGISM